MTEEYCDDGTGGYGVEAGYGAEAGGGVAGGAGDDKIFPSRHKWSIGVTAATVVSMTICVIGFGVVNSVTITTRYTVSVVAGK